MPASNPPDLALTADERERFNAAVTMAGLQPDTSWNHVINVTASGPVPSNYVTTQQVKTLEQLNAIIGAISANGNSGLPVPEAISKDTLAASISEAQLRHLRWSTDAYLFGDSAQPSPNADLINAMIFPITLTVIAAQSLTLAPNVTLSIAGVPFGATDPYGYVLLILGSLSIGAGALISSSANTVLNTQVAYSAND